MTTAQIQTLALRQADAASARIIALVFDQAKHRHVHHNGYGTIGCSCDYCTALHAYTHEKLAAHRILRRHEQDYEVHRRWLHHATQSLKHRAIKNQILADCAL